MRQFPIFLFFGWFNRTFYDENGRLKFCKGQGIHMIFGWLQIEEVIYTHERPVPEWLEYHPHALQRRLNRLSNCIYTGRERLSWNSGMKGYGIFSKASDTLILTKRGYSRSKWNLPEDFKDISITYHKNTSWKEDYFQSAYRGQEFVFEEHKAVELWAREIVENNQDFISYAPVYPAGGFSGSAAGSSQPGNHSGGGKKSEHDTEIGTGKSNAANHVL